MNLYQEDFDETDSASAGYADILSKMEKIDKDLRKVRKKRKGDKKGRKKKLKKRLKVLETELKCLQQNTGKGQKPAWWQNAFANALPKILDVASIVLQNRSQRSYSSQSPVYLTDGRDKK